MFVFRVHDRKMSIFGFCSVLLCLAHSQARPPALVELAPSFIPTVVTQLEALVEAYKGERVRGLLCEVIQQLTVSLLYLAGTIFAL